MITKNYKTIRDFNKDQNLPEPENPLFSIGNIRWDPEKSKDPEVCSKAISYTNDFYVISFKKIISGEIIYGRTKYDCDTGTLLFWSPNQTLVARDIVVSTDTWFITFHEDFIRGLDIRNRIKSYGFFNYYVNEALHLSPKEEQIIRSIFENILVEYNNNQDEFTKNIIIAHLETLLKYADRFYKRQFLNRAAINKDLIARFNDRLRTYFQEGLQRQHGIPTLAWVAEQLGVSQRYLSDSIKAETGSTAIDQINAYLIEEAKNLLLAPQSSIAETAYQLGFQYPQYFSRLFKKKTGVSPTEYVESASMN